MSTWKSNSHSSPAPTLCKVVIATDRTSYEDPCNVHIGATLHNVRTRGWLVICNVNSSNRHSDERATMRNALYQLLMNSIWVLLITSSFAGHYELTIYCVKRCGRISKFGVTLVVYLRMRVLHPHLQRHQLSSPLKHRNFEVHFRARFGIYDPFEHPTPLEKNALVSTMQTSVQPYVMISDE